MAITTTQITALQTAWMTQINDLTDPITRAEAEIVLQRYLDALQSQSQLEAGGIVSYSVAGRSITRNNLSESKNLIDKLKYDLYKLLYGSSSIVDMSSVGDI